MRLGLALPHYDFSFPDGRPATVERVAEVAARAEAADFDSVWVSDHLFLDLAKYGGPSEAFGTPEALAMLAALAERTERIRVGSLVLCAAFRPAAVTALAAQTIHETSGGRLDLGLGAGWYEPEFASVGAPFGSAGQRLAHLRTYAGVVRAALASGRVPPTPDQPPAWEGPAKDRPAVWIGGKGGPKLARIVAEHADGWNVVWRMTLPEYEQRLGVLREACDEAGRDPATVRRSVGLYTLLGSDEHDLRRRFRGMQRWAPGGMLDDLSLESFADGALAGSTARVAEQIRAFEALGVEEIILGFGALPFSVPDLEQLDLAAELLPLVR